MKIDLIAGARPNFVKIAALYYAYRSIGNNFDFRLIHTGQHYDEKLSGIFFKELGIPKPDFNLEVGSGSHAEQTAAIMIGYEQILKKSKPELVIVVGDVNSTMACSIVAKKLNIKVAHIEAGIRSGDNTMPEEINRIVTDSISDYFFTTTRNASNNLLKSGKNENQIYFVGNTMIDTLVKNRKNFKRPECWNTFKLNEREYFIMTLHRPNNVDEEKTFKNILAEINYSSKGLPVIFPVHPRTEAVIKTLTSEVKNIRFISPLSYLEFNYLVERSKAVITDSGGITEEATFFKVPCITLRESTERPETVREGTNELAGNDPDKISKYFERISTGQWKIGKVPEYWDGKTGERILQGLAGIKL
ncbi:UDP-N-acetylglucosamine 2-epimerase (non-hydrolyzing) [Gramella sp. AN32]|uniref:Non-hydrolyzing UDP-N-acetylglucosamine 2-epimerase n=1 Tax=Christiangramia antarctica TaxID=2058158 RepID=A0ABW5X6M2_9FLAO|nr:UDP-N-acetylglucosamine 2-epimerase (non-hydrolyzing) [Gramella sp. AN32]MCM4154696.1 UDP-N-acetylglucosamine 2-epimerase (non-hydrolyzing) [Gramella sp. AN32]